MSAKKQSSHSRFYLKRLNSQTFVSPSHTADMPELAHRIEDSIVTNIKQSRVKNHRMFRAKNNISQLHQQQEREREELREQLSKKMQTAEQQLEQLMLSKTKHNKSREDARNTTLSKIKVTQNARNQENFRRSQSLSRESERFLATHHSKRNTTRSRNNSPPKQVVQVPHQSAPVLQGKRQKILPRVLRVSEAEIKAKQAKKQQGRRQNQGKTLYDYIQKMQRISQGRQQRVSSISHTSSLLHKPPPQQRETVRATQHYRSPPKQASHTTPLPRPSPKPKNPSNFSEEYAMQLALKRKKKAELSDHTRRSNDRIVQRERLQKQWLHERALAEESVRQSHLRHQFRYMERLRNI